MRRRADSWLNATQILKVAGFDKPQRTRILEREVQKGIHEKVQGGYGKYQGTCPALPCIIAPPIFFPPMPGTWIPLERGLGLCQQYNCEALLRPIIDFQPDDKSPPLAPKHLVAAPSDKALSRAAPATSTISTRSSRRVIPDTGDDSEIDELSLRGSDDRSISPSPSRTSTTSRTPSPIRTSPEPTLSNMDDEYRSPSPPAVVTTSSTSRKRKYRQDAVNDDRPHVGVNGYPVRDAASYPDQMLEYFVSDTNQIPHLLIRPPADFDPSAAIDDDGHTALHWASAMGRIRVVKLLLSAGADIFRVNKAGQTPLMRSVMFANNYDVRKFPELYELLHRSTLNIDNNNRTVFHHIVDVAMSKNKTHAARYYMETVLDRLADYPRELADVINFQDDEGETPLTLAARCRSKRLVKILIDHGADPKIRNRDGKSAEDYILEDERFRASPLLPSKEFMANRNASAGGASSGLASPFPFGPTNGDRLPLHYSGTAQKASRCANDAAALLQSLAAVYDTELREKERDMTQANGLLQSIQTEILDSQRAVASLKSTSQPLPQAKERLVAVEGELRGNMAKRARTGWERWVSEEEEREKTLRDASGGGLAQFSGAGGVPRASNGDNIADLLALHADVPSESDPEALREACEKLRGEVEEHRKRRSALFEKLISAQKEAGTSGRMAEYRRLIGAGCGGLQIGRAHV